MSKHLVKCKICHQQFDANAEPFVYEGRRYSHKKCVDNLPQEKKDYEMLLNYIKELFNTSIISVKIKKQIEDFKTEYNYTYSGIFKTLYWWFEIQQQPIDKAHNGIGIVPYVYQDAYNYYYRLYMAQMANDISDIERLSKRQTEEIIIGSPRVRVNFPKLLDFEEEGSNE